MATVDLRDHAGAITVRKRPLPVTVHFASQDGVCQTLEGAVRFRQGDAIVTGPAGESWPMSRNRLLAYYEAMPPTPAGEDGTYVSRPRPALALCLDAPMEVPAGAQDDPLHGKAGDWLVQYADGGHGIVANAIFATTYERT